MLVDVIFQLKSSKTFTFDIDNIFLNLNIDENIFIININKK